MIYVLSLGRAVRFYPGRTALARDGGFRTFRELHTRVEGIAGTLTSHGFGVGDRLALLLPNGPDYIELMYACSMLGVIAVPLNTRLSTKEIDRVLEVSSEHLRVPWCRLPLRGLTRHYLPLYPTNLTTVRAHATECQQFARQPSDSEADAVARARSLTCSPAQGR